MQIPDVYSDPLAHLKASFHSISCKTKFNMYTELSLVHWFDSGSIHGVSGAVDSDGFSQHQQSSFL